MPRYPAGKVQRARSRYGTVPICAAIERTFASSALALLPGRPWMRRASSLMRQAQAERERQARVTPGSVEAEIAAKFVDAPQVYENRPGALQLRAMNIIYGTTKERGATIPIPSSMVGQPESGARAGGCRV
nr:hypothetical protein [Burkholderia oklahomensis]